MRLLPGYATAPSPAKSVAIHSSVARVATPMFVDAVFFELVPAVTANARSAIYLTRARTAIELYSAVYRISESSTGRLNVFG